MLVLNINRADPSPLFHNSGIRIHLLFSRSLKKENILYIIFFKNQNAILLMRFKYYNENERLLHNVYICCKDRDKIKGSNFIKRKI